MTYWESKTRVYAIDGLTVVSCIEKSSLKFKQSVEYSTIDWTSLTEITKQQFGAIRIEAIKILNEINYKFNQ